MIKREDLSIQVKQKTALRILILQQCYTTGINQKHRNRQ